jgi:hypothetical protein
MINREMLQTLYGIYVDLQFSHNKTKRKKINIIIDSIIEQLCSFYFGITTKGHQHLRLIINKKIETFNEEDKVVLKTLNAILRDYSNVFSKSYSDHEKDLNKFLQNELKDFCIAISEHSSFCHDDIAIDLRRLLHG